jgi:DNA polymerase-3 subunit beta
MKLVVNSIKLKGVIGDLLSVVPKNPLLPILGNLLVTVEGNLMKIVASDINTTMSSECEVNSEDNSSFCIPAKLFYDTLNNLPDQPIQVVWNEVKVDILTENGKFSLPLEKAEDYPSTPVENEFDESISLSMVDFKAYFGKVLFSVSKDVFRPAMNGVYLFSNESSVDLVSTDGHKMTKVGVPIEGTSFDHIVQASALKLAMRIKSEDVVISLNSNFAKFKFDGTVIYSRIINEKFPNYNAATPKEFKNNCIVNRQDLLMSVRRVSIYANTTTNQIKLSLGDNLIVSAEDIDFKNEAKETVAFEYEGDEMAIGFNAKFIQEILSIIDSDEIVIKCNEPNNAAVIEQVDEETEALFLIMPVMLNDYK